MTAAKAYAGALTALIVFVCAHFALELPAEVTAALETLITGAVVYIVKNREPAHRGGLG